MTDTMTATTATILDLEGPAALHLLDAIRAAAIVRSRDTYRPAICGVLLDVTPDDGVRVVATDSYRLMTATVRDAFADPVQFVIPGDMVPALAKIVTVAQSRKMSAGEQVRVIVTLDNHDIVATVTVGGTTTCTAGRDDGLTFPNYRALTPEHTCEHGAYNPAYLADLGKLAQAGAFDSATPVVTVSTHPIKPSIWTITDDRLAITYVLMPMRVL